VPRDAVDALCASFHLIDIAVSFLSLCLSLFLPIIAFFHFHSYIFAYFLLTYLLSFHSALLSCPLFFFDAIFPLFSSYYLREFYEYPSA